MQKIIVVSRENTPPEAEVNSRLEALSGNWKVISGVTIALAVSAGVVIYTTTLVVEECPREVDVNACIDPERLSVRVRKCLLRADIKTLKDLCKRTPNQLRLMNHFGACCLREVQEFLDSMGLRLRFEGEVGDDIAKSVDVLDTKIWDIKWLPTYAKRRIMEGP